MIFINWDQIDNIVSKEKPRSVLIVGPDGLITAMLEIQENLENKGIEAYISGDPSYGSCDLQIEKAFNVHADLIFNVGHRIGLERIGNTRFIDIEYAFTDETLERLSKLLLDYISSNKIEGKAGFYTLSNYYSAYLKIMKMLKDKIELAPVGKYETLLQGQVLGCNFYSAFTGSASYNILLGESLFHAIGLRLSTERRTLMMDPHAMEIMDVEDEAVKALRSSFARIGLAMKAERIGLIIGEKEGQVNLKKADLIDKELRKLGVRTVRIVMNEITPEKINKFERIDAFVEVACPRIPMNVEGFRVPVLSYPEALALIKLKKGMSVENPYRMAVWF
ncbi:MAG: diphthamide synthesis protein [Nitrososphaeria archaeon]